jgi:hypothetical protein
MIAFAIAIELEVAYSVSVFSRTHTREGWVVAMVFHAVKDLHLLRKFLARGAR